MHVVVGAGSVGRAVAEQLTQADEPVAVITRSGTSVTGARSVAADAASLTALMAAVPDATVIYNCANPQYHQWARDWPPIADALLDYAEQTGAVLATCSNLYGYGPVDEPMTELTPLAATGTKGRIRADMWLEAKRRHDAGRIRATEVRGSDYVTASEQSRVGSGRVVPRLLAGKSVSLIGGLDLPHTWTAPQDVARTLVTCAQDSRAWGRPWHVPSNPPRTQRQVIDDLADSAGVRRVPVRQIPDAVLWTLGLVNPMMKEFRETAYQLQRPYILDDTLTRETFALEPTPWSEIMAEVIAPYRTATAEQ